MQTGAELRQEPSSPTINANPDPSVAGGQGEKVLAAAATPETIVAASTPCRMLIITAKPTNTDKIAYGFSNAVNANGSNGALLAAGQSVSLPVADALLIWLDAAVNGEGVSYTYLK